MGSLFTTLESWTTLELGTLLGPTCPNAFLPRAHFESSRNLQSYQTPTLEHLNVLTTIFSQWVDNAPPHATQKKELLLQRKVLSTTPTRRWVLATRNLPNVPGLLP